MKCCLVTGGGGFLGLALVKMLRARGLEVRVLARHLYPETEALGAQAFVGDLADASIVDQAVAGCDTVFHTASKAGIWGDDSLYEATNVTGSRHILESCRKQGVQSLIYTSTPSVIYTPEARIEGIQEDMPYPDTFDCAYARTKAQAERFLLEADGGSGLRITALRPHLIYGPGDAHLIPRVIERARQGRLPQVGDGLNQVDLTYVDNAAQAHILAAEHMDKAHGKAYFISDGAPVMLWPWINELLARLDIPPIKRRVSLSLARNLGALMEGAYRLLKIKSEPKMTRFTAQQLATSHYFNISNAKRDLQYEPMVSGAEGVERLVKWIKEGGLEKITIR